MAFTGAKRKPLTEEAGGSGAAFSQEGLKEFGMPDSKLRLALVARPVWSRRMVREQRELPYLAVL
jgi:hypothetical protein